MTRGSAKKLKPWMWDEPPPISCSGKAQTQPPDKLENKTPAMIIYVPRPFLSNFCFYDAVFSSGSVNVSAGVKLSAPLPRVSTRGRIAAAAILAAATMIASAAVAIEEPYVPDTLSNVPQTLSGQCALPTDCKKARIQRPKSRKAESCTIKCVTTCIRGGEGSPGEGPLNIRRPIIVFKQGFRSRQYCLVECSDICNLIGDGDDGQ